MTEAAPTPRDLIESHQGLVRSLAVQIQRRFQGRFELDDLVAYGQLGLAEAAQEFDASRGTQFSTYAYYRVRGAIYDGISKMNWVGKEIPRQTRFRQMAGVVLEADQEAAASGSEPKTVAGETAWLVNLTHQLTVVYFAAGAAESIEQKAEDDPATPSASLVRRELHERLRAVVAELPDDERQLVQATYFEGETFQDVAVRLGISKSWASRVHARALKRLALALRQAGLAE